MDVVDDSNSSLFKAGSVVATWAPEDDVAEYWLCRVDRTGADPAVYFCFR